MDLKQNLRKMTKDELEMKRFELEQHYKYKIKIRFAHGTFSWSNEVKGMPPLMLLLLASQILTLTKN